VPNRVRQLATNEREIREAHRHVLFVVLNTLPLIFLGLLMWGLAFLGYRYISSYEGVLALVLLLGSLVPIGIATYRILWWRAEVYIVTNQRIIQIEGVIAQRTLDSSLGKVNDIELRQSLIGRMFDYGDINILTGSKQVVNDLHGIDQPFQFKKALLQAKAEFEGHRGNAREPYAFADVGDRTPVSQPPPLASEDTARILAALSELRNTGVLSETEYQEKLKSLLAS
jgi:hypothetical protein